MPVEIPEDFLERVQRSLQDAWEDHDGTDYTDADWGAVYKEALARPCIEVGLAVACTLSRVQGGGAYQPEVTKYLRDPQRMHSPEQALDFVAVDATSLAPILGAEIEWSANQITTHVQGDAKVLQEVWGETPLPDKGHVIAILYDLGRLLMVNPPYMVLEVYPRLDDIGIVKRAVESMYRRADAFRPMGTLLLSISRGPEFVTFTGKRSTIP